MTMQSLAGVKVAGKGAGFESGRESVRVRFGVGGGVSHVGIQGQSFSGHVVADEANDDGVPEKGGWVRQSFKQLAGKVRLAFLAESA